MWDLLGVSRRDLEGKETRLRMSDLKPENSAWGKTAKGLEGVSAFKAKLVGLFSGPGSRLDPRLTQEEINKKLDTNIVVAGKAVEDSVVTPLHSAVSKTIIVKGLCKIQSAVVSAALKKHIQDFGFDTDVNVRFSGEDAIVEVKSSVMATVLLSLNGKVIESLGEVPLELKRPNEYIQFDDPLKTYTGIQDSITESPRLLCCNTLSVGPSRDELVTTLSKYGELHSLKLVTQLNTMFFEYKNALDTTDIIKKLESQEKIKAFAVCTNQESSYLQKVRLTSSNFRQMVSKDTPEMTRHKETPVLQLLNMLTVDDLMSPETYDYFFATLEKDFATFEGFVKLDIPKPKEKPDINDMNLVYGKVYVCFKNSQQAAACLRAVAGRLFCNRMVIGGYIDETDYSLHII